MYEKRAKNGHRTIVGFFNEYNAQMISIYISVVSMWQTHDGAHVRNKIASVKIFDV